MNAKPQWTFETFHTSRCREQLQDPGNGCICRPPFEDFTAEAREQLARALREGLRRAKGCAS